MQSSNMAILALSDTPEHQEAWTCIRICYIEQTDSLKRAIADLDISRSTHDNRTRTFARHAISLARSLRAAAEGMSARRSS